MVRNRAWQRCRAVWASRRGQVQASMARRCTAYDNAITLRGDDILFWLVNLDCWKADSSRSPVLVIFRIVCLGSLDRSEERRVGKECCRTCRYRWSPYHKKKNHIAQPLVQ